MIPLLLNETVHSLRGCDVESVGAGTVLSMLADKIVKPILSAANGDDFGTFLDESIGEGSSNAGCSADHEDMFVPKRHFESSDTWCLSEG